MFLIPADETQLEFIKKEDTYQPLDRLEEDVTQLIEWLSKQPHLPKITDRAWLSHFITGCKYNLQRAKQVIESYYIVRAKNPEFVASISKERFEELWGKIGTFNLLPKLTPEGSRINYTKTAPYPDGNDFDIMFVTKVYIAILDLQLKEEPMYGTTFLFDLKHVQLSYILAYTPTFTKKLFSIALDSFPLRVSSAHFINPPKFMGRIMTFFKMFVPPKIRERLFIHETVEDLHQYIPKECLPDILGGTVGKMEDIEASMRELLLANLDWFAQRPVADLEKLPPGHEKSDELDMTGTFKKLEID